MKVSPIDPQFMTERQGRPFCLYQGLLDAAHRSGLRSITTHMEQAPNDGNGNLAVVSAVASFLDGDGAHFAFAGLGDASPANVGRMIAPHILRMAETRAKARALRDALNIGVAAVEELGDDDGPAPAAAAPKRTQQQPAAAPAVASQEQYKALRALLNLKGSPDPSPDISAETAATLITKLRGEPATEHAYQALMAAAEHLYQAGKPWTTKMPEDATLAQALDLLTRMRAAYREATAQPVGAR